MGKGAWLSTLTIQIGHPTFCRLKGLHSYNDFSVRNSDLLVAEHHKFLGIIFDRQLGWLLYVKALKRQ